MATPQKEKIVDEMKDKFGRASSIYLVDFTGMDVNLTNELRRNFRDSNVEYRVMKNTLAKLSFEKAGIEGMNDFLTGVNAYAISYDDPTLPVKVLKRNKEFKEKPKLKAALFEGQVVGAEKVENLANLPTREELLGQLVGMLNSPMTKLVNTLNGAMSKLVYTLKSLEEKKNN
ncbi:MAG: 50S ribosomal protein L10 [Calditrichaeota bacterium]|nr:50S ribosomal protein L10 [Calditrichota bacterium]RQW06253.1 MAG: 50S ribosomal protein L10 [Calditrichota bacterium]